MNDYTAEWLTCTLGAETSDLKSAASGETSRGVIGGQKSWRVIRLGPDEYKRLAAYHGLLKRKYEKAAAMPWLPVESDTEPSEYSRIADEQAALPTAEPPSWLTVPGAATGLSKSAVSSGQ